MNILFQVFICLGILLIYIIVNIPNQLFSFSADILPEVKNRGAYLSPSDLEGISTLVCDLIKGVINHTQKRLMFLHEQV